jgi:hypothetical protein
MQLCACITLMCVVYLCPVFAEHLKYVRVQFIGYNVSQSAIQVSECQFYGKHQGSIT